MAIAVPATRLVTGTFSGASFNLVLGSTPTAGSMILISLAAASNTATITSITDGRGNTYVQVFDSGNQSAGVRTYLWMCAAQHDLVSGDILLIQNASATIAYAIDQATGLGTAHDPDQTITNFSTTNVSSFTTGASGATGYADELVWVVMATPTPTITAQSMTAGAGYTQQGSRVSSSVGISMYVEYKIVAATGAQTGSGNINTTAAHYATGLATFAAPQSPDSANRATSFAGVNVAATVGVNRGASFVGANVSAVVGVNRGTSFVGVEVAGVISAPTPPNTKRRPFPIVA